MPSPFDASAARTLQSVFARFGTPASYVSPDLVTTDCRIVVNSADEVVALGNVPIVAGRMIVEVRASEIAAPSKGGAFIADNREFKIVGAPRHEDPSGLVWTCMCDPQPCLS
ncbi:head-tail joining protein [Methylocystis rosea]|uniref:head-tail joining protein n=1 Tax=Methylocystis rosea TaxID=173366 RepID=UPI00035E2305|nr:hypothetical protein [Methylocystis rosea]